MGMPQALLVVASAALSPVERDECREDELAEGETCFVQSNNGCDTVSPSPSSCCVPSAGGCDDPACERLICGFDPFCCSRAWDQICADEAIAYCPWVCSAPTPQWGSLHCGDILCGTLWADRIHWPDADWYELALDRTTTVTLNVSTDVPLIVGIVDPDGALTCEVAGKLDPMASVAAGESASLVACLEEGPHWVVVRVPPSVEIPCTDGTTHYTLTVSCGDRPCTLPQPPNDLCENALPAYVGDNAFTTVDANTDGPLLPKLCSPEGHALPVAHDVWFSFVAPFTGLARFSTCHSADFPTAIAVYAGTCDELAWTTCGGNTPVCPDGRGTAFAEVEANHQYLVRVGGATLEEGTGLLSISEVPCSTPVSPYFSADPEGSSLEPFVLSSNGIVAGKRFDHDWELFLWSEPTGFVHVDVPVGYFEVTGVNSEGIVVGEHDPNSGENSAFMIDGGGWHLLPALPGDVGSQAHAISDDGVIVGGSWGPSGMSAVRWVNGVAESIAPAGSTFSVALDITEAGAVCGSVSFGPYPEFPILGFIAVGDSVETCDLPSVVSRLRMNSLGDLAGTAWMSTDGAPPANRAFVRRNGAIEIIQPPTGFTNSFGNDIGEDGSVVGSFSKAGYGQAFLWRDGVATSLNSLVDPAWNMTLVTALAVNSSGLVLAAGSPLNVIDDPGVIALVTMLPADADFNCDGVVDGADLASLLGGWGPCSAELACDLDLDLNGDVDGGDLAILLGQWTGTG